MSFDALITKVQQAEAALESRERRTIDQWQQVKTTWRRGWTPGRIVIAGLAAGFMVGRARPLRAAAESGGLLQMLTALSGLVASGSAQFAAEQAGDAADAAQTAAITPTPATDQDAA